MNKEQKTKMKKKCGCEYYKNSDGTVVYVGYCDNHLAEDLKESGVEE